MKQPINIGSFRLVVSLCGEYWVAPGGFHIASAQRAEQTAEFYARRMRG